MKTVIKTILCAAAVVMASVSCQKSAEPVQPAEEGKGTIDISVNGLMGEYSQQDGVKSSLVNNVRVAWAAGDVVYVFDGSKYLGKLTAALDKKADGQTDEDRYAKLGGTISAPATTPCVLSLVHSSLMTEPETGAAVSELSIDMSAQSTATVPFVAYATLEYTGTTITDVVVPFQFATSVIKVNCTGLWANTAITSATLSNVNTVCKLTLSGSTAPTVSGGTNGTITRTGDAYFAADKVNSEGEAVFQIAVPTLEAASGARVLTVEQGSDKVKDLKFTTKSLVAATSVNTVCQLVELPAGVLEDEFSVSDTKKILFSKGNLTYNVSTTTWAFYEHQYDCATSYDSNLISLFTWGYFGAYTSLNPKGNEYVTAHTEDGDILVYDVASPYGDDWGVAYCESNNIPVGTWRTLTKEEWQYLFKTDTPNRMVNGKPCYSNAMSGVTIGGATYKGVFLYPDDYSGKEVVDNTETWTWDKINSACIVFLPAAGDRSTSYVIDVGVSGHYWSSTAYDKDSAYDVYFDSKDVGPGYRGLRNLGFSVRLITDSSELNEPPVPDPDPDVPVIIGF